ncbi:hypothetical protein E1301_Tti023156 [Triplophysa tibetana]|uniref:Uncharacterized protein n=1 Tax=Triplophysa tibetana TaxID=1572043 RepID=A0A5A9NPQ2_9TELE|nr:hypothetical protein E1301_Tti023156 [Triplophysa tibetana]
MNDIKGRWSTLEKEEKQRYCQEAAALRVHVQAEDLSPEMRDLRFKLHLKKLKRDPASDERPPKGQEAMGELSKTITWHKQLGIRINSESEMHATLMSLSGNMEFWSRRLRSQSGPERHPSGDWVKMEEALGSLINLFEDAVLLVDSTQLEQSRANKIEKKELKYKI